MNTFELPYLAALIDGEGCIDLNKHNHTITLTPRVRVGMTNINIILDLREQFGGSFHTRKANANRKAAYTWSLTGKPAVDFLLSIRQWLRIKGPQADLVIGYHNIKQRGVETPFVETIKASVKMLELKREA